MGKSVNILCFIFLVLFIFYPFLNLKASEVIDPDNYVFTIGRVESSIRGGCVYSSDNYAEGFDCDTLRWRHKILK